MRFSPQGVLTLLSNEKRKYFRTSFSWRRVRDSNPRMLSHQRFSRPPLSTAQPTLQSLISISKAVFCVNCFFNFILQFFYYFYITALLTFYASATSSIIITTKPTIVPHVARCEYPVDCASGIRSSATTKIIAPAAKASSHGCNVIIYDAKK